MLRKLKVDGSSLWDDPENQFVLRFNDINETKQKKFAKRLMETDKHWNIRHKENSFVDEILALLKEINPSIYVEGKRDYTYTHWRKWNKNNVYALSGWSYQYLSKYIYRFLCVKKEKNKHDLTGALILSTIGVISDRSYYDKINELLATLPENTPTQIHSPSEISMEEVRVARERAERRS